MSDNVGKNYFEKIIQLPISLPPVSEQSIEQLVLSLSKGDTELKVVAKLFAIGLPPNPRKVKRALQIFLFIRSLASISNKSKELESSLLVKIVLIQMQCKPLYTEISKDPDFLIRLEEHFVEQEEFVNPTESVETDSEKRPINERVIAQIEQFSIIYEKLAKLLTCRTSGEDTFIGKDVKQYVYLIQAIEEKSAEEVQQRDPSIRKYLQKVTSESAQVLRQTSFWRGADNFRFILDNSTEDPEQEMSVEQLFEHSSQILITGGPGAGKTTLSYHLQSIAANSILKEETSVKSEFSQKSHLKSLVPVLVKLRDFGGSRGLKSASRNTIIDFLKDSISARYNFPKSKLSIFEKEIEMGRCLLIFDGFDEIHPDSRYSFISALEDFIVAYPSNYIVLLSRPYTISASGLDLARLTRTRLKPWTKEQAFEYIKLELKEPEASILIRSLNSHAGLSEYALNPLLLNLILFSFKELGEIPREPQQLTRRYVELVINKREQKKGKQVQYSRAILSFFLAMANYMKENQLLSIDRTQLEEIAYKVRSQISPDYFLDEIKRFIGSILVVDESGRYSFLHQLLYEHFSSLPDSKFDD